MLYSLVLSFLPENVLVLDIARGQWGRALSIEQAGQGVGEGDEEGEDVDVHEGGVLRVRLHKGRYQLQTVGADHFRFSKVGPDHSAES